MTSIPKIFIFDFDGTIADTYSYMCQISNILSQRFGYNRIDDHEVEMLKEKTSEEIIRFLKVPFHKIPAIVNQGKKEFHKNLDSLKPFDGIKTLLQDLNKRQICIGVVSSNSKENVLDFLRKHDMDIFDFVETTSRIWSKNHPLQKIIRQKNFDKNDVVYVGDEIRDIKAARKAGIRIFSVTWGYNSKNRLKQFSPDMLIDYPQQLLMI